MLHVYGKPGCSRCEVLKRQLTAANLPFHYYTLDVDYNRDWLMTQIPKSARQMPMVFEENEKGERHFIKEDKVNKMLVGQFKEE